MHEAVLSPAHLEGLAQYALSAGFSLMWRRGRVKCIDVNQAPPKLHPPFTLELGRTLVKSVQWMLMWHLVMFACYEFNRTNEEHFEQSKV